VKKRLAPDVSIAFGNTAIILNALSRAGEKQVASIRQSFGVIMHDASLAAKMHLKMYVWALRRSDLIVPVSRAINGELQNYFGITNEHFINNGFDGEAIRRMSADKTGATLQNKKWIVHTGRFDRSKGQWHLVKIFATIKKDITDLGLIFIGQPDEDAGPLSIERFCKNYLTQQGISFAGSAGENADVLFLGHQANPFKFITQATLFVFPSVWEGFPNALLEAMSCAVPVVSANCQTGPAEILLEGNEKFGLLLPPFENSFHAGDSALSELEKEWVKAISVLLNDGEKMTFFSNQSLIRSKKYSIEKTGTKWRDLLEKV
jgi:glycosyltransferase involved in cell wall biosynthesis